MSALRAQILPQPGDAIAGRYRVETILGKGGMGAVYRAVHEASGRAVAIKWMLPSAGVEDGAVERFLAEARTMARIEHPNVVAIVDMGEDRGAPFLVMELLRGESLRQRLDRARLGVAEAIDLLLPAMRGVAEAHHEGIVHRDLKPDNIFLCQSKDGRPREAKVLDFGVSKLSEQTGPGTPMTRTGVAVGTPKYMAPEQLNAPKVADRRFDVYAMGIVLYECLTGQPPYDAEGLMELLAQIGAGRAIPPSQLVPEIPRTLENVVLTAMWADIQYRYATMDDFIAALEQVRATLGASSMATGPIPRAQLTPLATPPGASYATTPQPDYASGPVPRGVGAMYQMSPAPTPQGTAILHETPQPAPLATPAAEVRAPAAGRTSLVWLGLGGIVLLAAAIGGLVLGFWVLAGDDAAPSAAHEAPAPEVPAAVVAPTPEPPRAPAQPTAPREATYASLTADVAAHAGETVAFSGIVALREPGDDSAFFAFVREEGCGGSNACVLFASGAPLAPPEGQAIRIHGRVEGTHAYRTRDGAAREAPHVSIESLELLRALAAATVDESQRPASEPVAAEPVAEPVVAERTRRTARRAARATPVIRSSPAVRGARVRPVYADEI